jgi:hypothetical protein
MAYLVLTIPNTERGQVAVRHLVERGEEDLGCRYQLSLSDRLEGLESAGRLRELPQTFHLVQVRDGDESGAANRILRFHDGERPGAGRVDAVEVDAPLTPSTPFLGLPFSLGGRHRDYLDLINVGDAHRDNVVGQGVRIAVVDSGLDPAQGLSVADFYDVVSGNPVHAGPANLTDTDGHGTAMASLIAAVAPAADLYVVRAMDQGYLTLWNVLAGAGVAAFDCLADVISMSLGFTSFLVCPVCGASGTARSVALEKLLDGITRSPYRSGGKEPIYLASTGNDSSTTSLNYPAGYASAVPVGAVDYNRDRSSFSNYDSAKLYTRHIMAPGGEKSGMTITEDVGRGGSNQCCGTSVSTAYAAGMLALFSSDSRYNRMDRDQFLDCVLQNQCVRCISQSQYEYGAGLIQYTRGADAAGDAESESSSEAGDSTASISCTEHEVIFQLGQDRLTIPRRVP